MHWNCKHYFQLLNGLDHSISLKLLRAFLDYISIETDQEDVDLLLDINEWLFTFENSVLYNHGTDDEAHSDMPDSSSDLMTKVIDLNSKVNGICLKTRMSKDGFTKRQLRQFIQMTTIYCSGQTHVLNKELSSVKKLMERQVQESQAKSDMKPDVRYHRLGDFGEYLSTCTAGSELCNSPFTLAKSQEFVCKMKPKVISFLLSLNTLIPELSESEEHFQKILNSIFNSELLASRCCGVPAEILREQWEINFESFYAGLENDALCEKSLEVECEETAPAVKKLCQMLEPLHCMIQKSVNRLRTQAADADRRLNAVGLLISQKAKNWEGKSDQNLVSP